MVKKPSSTVPRPAKLSRDEVTKALLKLRRRVQELESFNISSLTEEGYRSTLSDYRDRIDATICDIYPPDTTEYRKYRSLELDNTPVVMGRGHTSSSLHHHIPGIKTGVSHTISRLRTLIQILEEEEALEGGLGQKSGTLHLEIEQACEPPLNIFVSHSARDVELVDHIVKLIRAALPMSAAEIRCTSLDGFRLAGGANTVTELKREVRDAKAFIGVISPASLDSIFVAFELGARWGFGKHLVPLLAPGADPAVLRGPLTGINALSCNSAAQLHQLIDELSQTLEKDKEPSAVFQRNIEDIVAMKPAPAIHDKDNAVTLFDQVRLHEAADFIAFLSRALNREAPEMYRNKHEQLKHEWAVQGRKLYMLHAPEDLRERLDERMVQYIRSLREFEGRPSERPEVERQRELAKRDARQLLLRLGLTAEWD